MLKKSIHLVGIIVLASLILFGCGKKKAKKFSKKGVSIIYYAGCGITKKAFMKEMGRAYEKKTGVYVSISGGGATKGIRNAAAKNVQIGGGCRHKLDFPEEENAKGNLVAWDALVVIVHKDNPVENISAKDLKAVLTGKITNWKRLGGDNAKIVVVARKGKISGVGLMTRELIFNDPDASYTKKARSYPSSGPLEKAVQREVNALGITGISSGRKRKVNFLSVDDAEPTYENIASGEYPYFRPLYLYTSLQPDKVTIDFIKFVLSKEGQSIIKQQKTVNIEDGNKGNLLEKYGEKMKAMNITNWKG